MHDITPILFITALAVVVAIGIILLILLYKKKQVQYLHEKERLQQKFEREILESQLEMREQTFKEVSEEIHDNVAQVLTLAKLNLSTLDLSSTSATSEKVALSKQYISRAIQDLRDLARAMNTDFFAKVGLENAIQDELKKIEKTGLLTTKFESGGNIVSLDFKKEIILFRIVQEAIQNVLKHSGASVLCLTLNYEPDNFCLKIKDNGNGFDAKSFNQGNGMINMANRCKLINASYNIESAASTGTSIYIKLPLMSKG